MSSTALSMNIVLNSAIKGSSFLQASTKGIYQYSSKVQKINLFKATKFGVLNRNVKTLDNLLNKLAIKTNHISKNPIKLEVNRAGLSATRKEFARIAKYSQMIYNYSKLTNANLRRGATSFNTTRPLTANAPLTNANLRRGATSFNTTRPLVTNNLSPINQAPTTNRPTSIPSRQPRRTTAPVTTTSNGVMGSIMGASILIAPFKASIAFESEMIRVQALSGAKPLVFKALVTEAKHLGATTAWKATEVAQGMQKTTMAGFTPKQTIDSMHGILNLATVAGDGVPLATTADIATDIMGGFKIDPSKAVNGMNAMDYVADVLAKTITTANTDIEKLGLTMKYVGPIAQTVGMSLQETASMAGLLGNIGIKADTAGTTLRSMLTRMAAPTKKAQKALRGLGLELLDSKDNIRSIPTVLKEIAKATDGMGSGKKLNFIKTVFGVEPASGILSLIEKGGSKELDKYIGIVEQYKGTAQKIADKQLSATAGSFLLLGSATEGLAISATTPILPVIKATTRGITKLASTITTLTDKYPTITKYMFGFGAVAIAGALALATFGFVATMASTGITILGGAFAFMGSAMLLNPIGLAITAVTALAGSAYLIYTNWNLVKTFWSSLWVDTKAKFTEGIQYLKSIISWNPRPLIHATWGKLSPYFGALVKRIKAPFVNFFSWIAKKFAWVAGMVGKVKSLTNGIVQKTKNIFSFGNAKEATRSKTLIERARGLPRTLQPINNSNYKSSTNITSKPISMKEQLFSNSQDNSIIQKPNYHQIPTTFGSINDENKEISSMPKDISKNTSFNIDSVQIKVTTTDGVFDADNFLEQFERATKERDWDKENTQHADTA